jgi:hypothetical protein
MATTKLILTSCVVTVNDVDLSDHCSSVEVALKKDSVDTTNFGGQGKEQEQGLENDMFTLELQQDYSAAEVDSVLWPLYESGDEFTVTVKPVTGSVSLTNPEYSATCILMEYSPLSGKPGQLSTVKVPIPVQRNTFARATS